MRRDPSTKVKIILRQEINYGCPIPGCGNPFLTWHHFDPPWSVKEHHDPKGMIALCTQHHPMADEGTFSNDQLRQFKTNPNPIEYIRGKFEWMSENCIIRLGGCYARDWCRITIVDTPILEVSKDQNNQTTISFLLKTEQDELAAIMTENFLNCPTQIIHDLSISASGNRIKIWFEERQIGFAFHYSRESPREIEQLIDEDTPEMPEFVRSPSPIDDIEVFYRELS